MQGYTTDTGLMVIDAEKVWEITQTSDALAAEQQATKFRTGLLQRKPREVMIRNLGGPASNTSMVIKLSDWGNSEHEFDDHQDAVARPDHLLYKMRPAKPMISVGANIRPLALAARSKVNNPMEGA
jgi:hypothetical protein